jgi:hypothetical protein
MVTEIFIDGKEIEENCVSSVVTLRENAVDDCLLVANNEKGIAYLHAMKLKSEVRVKYYYADKTGDAPYEVFRGKVAELNPSTTITGEIVSVRANGKAIAFKNMRVAQEYGTQSALGLIDYIEYDDILYVDEYNVGTHEWNYSGASPYLQNGDGEYIIIALNSGNQGKKESWFKFDDAAIRDVMTLDTVWLQIRAATSTTDKECYITVTLNDGVNNVFLPPKKIKGGWTWYIYDIKNVIDVSKLNDYKMQVTLFSTNETSGSVLVSAVCWYIHGEGYNGSIDTLKQILTDDTYGIVPLWVEKIMNGTTDSGYSIDTTYVYDDPLLFPYLYFPFESAFNCLRNIINLLSALRHPDAGPHWITTPDGKLLIAPIGLHQENGIPEDIWNNYARISPLEVKKQNIIENFVQEEPEANYVLVAGRFEYPMNEQWTERGASLWEYEDADPLGAIENDQANAKVGTYCLKFTQSRTIQHYRVAEDIDVDFTKLWSKKNVPTVNFWFRTGGLGFGGGEQKIVFYKDWDNYFEYSLSGLTDNVWEHFSIGLDDANWVKVGSLTWAQIDYVGISYKFGIGIYGNVWLDGLTINGAVIRAAYHSGNITLYDCKMKLIKDSLASTDTLIENDDSSMLALQAKAELIRAMHPLLHGKIMIELDPRIKAGQLVHIHAGRTDTANVYQIDQDFRIIEVQHTFSTAGALTTLTLVDDLKNSISIGPVDSYSALIRSVSPDFQNKTLASVLATAELDPDLTILAKDYDT